MTETEVKVECKGCGSSVGYSAKDQARRCPYCGTLTEISQAEEELPDQPLFLIPLRVELAQLTDAVYAHLASGDMTPDELLEFATFTKKERFYAPVFAYAGDFEAQWTASFGYDRYEDYTAYEKKTENGHTHTVAVTKTRMVTDWRPVSGTDTGGFQVRAYAGRQLLRTGTDAVSLVEDTRSDDVVSFDPSYLIGIPSEPYELSEDDAYRERGDSQVSEVIKRSVRQHAQGDRQRDWHWSASIRKKSATLLVPVCHAVYEYKGQSYHVWLSGTDASRLVADNLPVDGKRKRSIQLGFLPFGASAVASGLAIFALHYNWLVPVSVGLLFLLLAFMRKSAILRNSIEVRRWLLANKQAAGSNTAALASAQQGVIAKSIERPRRPLLSDTSGDGIVIPLLVLFASVLPFSEYLAPRDTSQQAQYTEEQSSTASTAAPVSVPPVSVDQNILSSGSSDSGPAHEYPAALEENHDPSNTDAADAAVQPARSEGTTTLPATDIPNSKRPDGMQELTPTGTIAQPRFAKRSPQLQTSGIVAPVLIQQEDPVYPANARHLQPFIVTIELDVDALGLPKNVRVSQSSHMETNGYDQEFEASAIKAVEKYRFQPALQDGKPVPVEMKVAVEYSF